MTKLKIFEILPSLNCGGGESFVIDLCNELNEQGHDVVLLTLFDVTEDMFIFKRLSPEINHVSFNKSLGIDFKVFYRLFKYLLKHKPDVIHSHLRALEYISPTLPFLKSTTVFHTLHSNALVETSMGIVRFFRKILYKANAVFPITISQDSSDSFQQVYGLKNNRLIFNGRAQVKPTDHFKVVQKQITAFKDSGDIVFINVANLSKEKNHKLLLKTFTELEKNGEKFKLLIIGGKRLGNEEIYENVVNNNSKSIIYLGEKSNVDDYLICSDFFTLSSKMEGMPITIIESFSCGCIPVCTPAGGVKDMILDQYNGFLAKENNFESYYQTLLKCFTLEECKLKVLRDNGKKSYHNNYSISQAAEDYATYFNSKSLKNC